MRAIRWGLVSLAVLATTGCGWEKKGQGSAAIAITASVANSGDISVTETFTLTRSKTGTLTPLSRRFWVNPATFPLRQHVVDVAVTGANGDALRFRRRSYGDWINVDLLEIPPGDQTTVMLTYTVKRGLTLSAGKATWRWTLVGAFWNVPITSLELAVSLPANVDPKQVSQRAELDYAEVKGLKPTTADGVTRWRLTKPIPPNRTLDWTLSFPRGDIQAATGYGKDLFNAISLVLLGAGLLLVIALVLLVLPTRWAIAATPVANAIAVAIALGALGHNAYYWYFEAGYRPGEFDNVITEQVMFAGFIVILVGMAAAQHRALRAGKRSAYFSQFALPVALALPMPMYPTNPMLAFLPVLGLPMLIYWYRPSIALHFGAGMHRLLEHVNTEGEVGFSGLAAKLGIPETQLARLLADRPGLPVVVDFGSRMVYSPAAAAIRRDFLICSTCGAGTEIKGQELAACGHCGREYAASRKAKPQNPTPVFVDAIASVVHMFGMFFIAWAVLLAVGFSLLGLIGGGGLVIAVVAGVVIAIPGVVLVGTSGDFRKGTPSTVVTVALLLTSPLVFPLLAYLRLKRRRIQLFFGEYKPVDIAKQLGAKGELSLDELAALLETNVEEAAEVARYLAGNDLVDGVFDRHGMRLVARAAYRTMAQEGSCNNCGGVLGVIAGQAACHYCGEPAR